MISTFKYIEKTPMIVSTDDLGLIKVNFLSKIWDIRKLCCLQTISLDSKNIIIQILDLQKNQKLAFLGRRINLLGWD